MWQHFPVIQMSKALLVLGNLIIHCILYKNLFSNFAGSVHACFPVVADLMKLPCDKKCRGSSVDLTVFGS